MKFLFLLAFLVVVSIAEECDQALPIPPCGIKRTFSGECNNPVFTDYGKSNNYLMRGAEGVRFVDGLRQPVLTPNMRTVSNDLFRADDGLNLAWTFFGQFIAHDMLGVHRKGDNGIDQAQPVNNTDVWVKIPLEQANDYFHIAATPPIAVDYMTVLRSRGDIVNGVFQVGTDSTSYMDLDSVYGKDDNVAVLLRKYSGGLLKTRTYTNYSALQGPAGNIGATTIPPNQYGTFGEWMPLVDDVDPNRQVIPINAQLTPSFTLNVTKRFFATGDGRNSENYWLATFHGMFLREHNRIARQAAKDHPSWTDEQLFTYARNLNIAQYQSITMYEYLPSVLQNDYNQIGTYNGYDPFIDPQASQLFAFAFRFGHTTVPNTLSLKNKCGNPAFNSSRDGPRSGQMAQIFMPADQMAQNGNPENVLHGILFQGARAIDFQFPESLRSIGFGANVDVIVQNQLRAADNGIPDYNTIRKLWNGGQYPSVYDSPKCDATETSPSPDPLPCWLIFTSNTTAAARLKDLYGKLNNLNFYTAVVGEEQTRSVVGQTSARIIADQFRRSRDGDRWWFENPQNGMFTTAEARNIKKDTTIQSLLQRNFPSANVPDNAFYTPKPRFFRNCVP